VLVQVPIEEVLVQVLVEEVEGVLVQVLVVACDKLESLVPIPLAQQQQEQQQQVVAAVLVPVVVVAVFLIAIAIATIAIVTLVVALVMVVVVYRVNPLRHWTTTMVLPWQGERPPQCPNRPLIPTVAAAVA
jgi:hypothetical protein